MKNRPIAIFVFIFIFIFVIGCDSNSQTNITTNSNTTNNITTTQPRTDDVTSNTEKDPNELVYISNESDYVVREYLGGVEIISYTGSDMYIQIPSKISDKSVLKIGNYAFNKNQTVEAIVLSEGITEIGDFAFVEATNLEYITLPKTISVIGEDITKDCEKLSEIIIPEGNDSFYSIDGILFKTITEDLQTLSTGSEDEPIELVIYPQGITDEFYEIPEGVEIIGKYAFKGNEYLKEIIIPGTVTFIGDGAFMYCKSLETLTIPSSATYIPTLMCYGCESLVNLTFSEGLTDIERKAFMNCVSLSDISFPDTLTHIGSQAFENIGDITKVHIPDMTIIESGSIFSLNPTFKEYTLNETNQNYTVEDGVIYTFDFGALVAYPSGKDGTEYTVHTETSEIGIGAFQGNYHLETVKFSDCYIERFFQYSFAYCKSLKTVFIPNNVTRLSYSVFYKSNAIEEYVVSEDSFEYTSIDGVLYSYDLSTLYFYPASKQGTEYTIPQTTTTIKDISFFENKYLERIVITKNVESIRGGAFAAMFSLNEIIVVEENEYYTSVDGVLYTKDLLTLVTYPSNKLGDTFDIPETVERLYFGSFEGNTHLRYLRIPNTVTMMNSYAFQQCPNLEWVIVPTSIETLYRNITTEAPNVIIYFEGSLEDYELSREWNLDNRPFYFFGEWILDEDNEPVVANIELNE